MGFMIEDGKGSGKKAHVNDDQHLIVRSITSPEDFFVNRVRNNVWSIPFENLSPTGADDYILYIKNDGDKSINITDIRIMAETAATQVTVVAVTGTASGGNTVTPVNRTVANSNQPSATIQTGANITGLTDDGVIFYIQCDTTGQEKHLSTSSRIRIPKDKAVALKIENASASLTGIVSIVQEDISQAA